jgi:hypothetical protein
MINAFVKWLDSIVVVLGRVSIIVAIIGLVGFVIDRIFYHFRIGWWGDDNVIKKEDKNIKMNADKLEEYNQFIDELPEGDSITKPIYETVCGGESRIVGYETKNGNKLKIVCGGPPQRYDDGTRYC